MKNNTEKLKVRLRNLPQYHDKTDEELEKIIREKNEQDEMLSSLSFCLDSEKPLAKKLLENYLTEASFENFSERQTLGQLIDQELLSRRLKESLKTLYDSANPSIPLQMVEQLDAVIDRIESLKQKLGLLKKDEKNDTSKVISDLTERFHKWINKPENRSNYEFQCPKCEEIFLIRRRLDKISDEVREHPWFIAGGILFNRAIFEDMELGKISEDQVARYTNTTLDYIHWIRVNYPLNQDKNEETENEE